MAKKWGIIKFLDVQWRLSVVDETDLNNLQTAGKITISEKNVITAKPKKGVK